MSERIQRLFSIRVFLFVGSILLMAGAASANETNFTSVFPQAPVGGGINGSFRR